MDQYLKYKSRENQAKVSNIGDSTNPSELQSDGEEDIEIIETQSKLHNYNSSNQGSRTDKTSQSSYHSKAPSVSPSALHENKASDRESNIDGEVFRMGNHEIVKKNKCSV